ncbi:hypothetical protein, partial [Cohnella zeiphila]
AVLIGCAGLAGGCGGSGEASPRDAFALTASALSGVDRYSFAGELTQYGPDGKVERRSGYRGRVEDHRPAAMQWNGGAAAGDGEGRHPLELAAALQAAPAAVEYVPASGMVKLRITLDPAAAKERVARPLRSRLSGLKRDGQDLLRVDSASPDARESAAARERETRRLERKLSTLRVATVCEWTADRRTWFPSELREETTVAYRDENGRDIAEKTTSVTNFRK